MGIEIIKPIKLGIIASSGGAAITTAYEIFNEVYPGKLSLIVATDRPCGIEDYCQRYSISCQRFSSKNNQILSEEIFEYFYGEKNIDVILLFFLRLITKELFSNYPCLNIHPSLLPNFPSFNPLNQAIEAKASEIGATIHIADYTIDGGEIIVQTTYSLPSKIRIEEAERLSFCQKTYLSLVLISALSKDLIRFDKLDNGIYTLEKEPEFMKQLSGHLEEIDSDINVAYRSKMTEMNYQQWLM